MCGFKITLTWPINFQQPDRKAHFYYQKSHIYVITWIVADTLIYKQKAKIKSSVRSYKFLQIGGQTKMAFCLRVICHYLRQCGVRIKGRRDRSSP